MSRDAVVVRAVGDGAAVRLRVKPGARRTRLVGPHGGALKLEVTTAPEKGRANRAVERLLAERLGLPAAVVRIVAGETSQDKVVEVAVAAEELVRRLAAVGIEAATV